MPNNYSLPYCGHVTTV